jgi:microcompartment protein CcmL/EutN
MARAENPTPRGGLRARPCVGLLEITSIAKGLQTADAVLWESSVELLFCEPVSPGKLVLLFTGEVEEVRSSMRRGMEVAGEELAEQILIPNLETSVLEALHGRLSSAGGRALGVIETSTLGATLLAADVAVKTAAVVPVELRLGNQIGGKAFVTLAGEVGDIRAAVAAGAAIAEERGHLVREVVIAGPHPDLARYLRPGATS